MSVLVTVKETSSLLEISPETVRRGIVQGSLPGTIVRSEAERTRFIIPRRALDLYISTGITPLMLAKSVMQAETVEQGLAYLRKITEGDKP